MFVNKGKKRGGVVVGFGDVKSLSDLKCRSWLIVKEET
jgi:hypothetical protein